MSLIHVYLGTGGVGKTTIAAAAALKAALEGQRVLVLTIDPARRLRTALKIELGGWQQRVEISGLAGQGELWAAMLDVRSTLDRAVELYAAPEQAQAIFHHPIYAILVSSLAGMQELMAVERLDQALQEGFETVVIDTAPSRHALEFLDKPQYFAQLASLPMVRLVGRTYKWWESMPLWSLSRKTLEVYTRVESILGSKLVRQILDFYSVFRSIAEGYASRAVRTTALLRDASHSSFHLVTTPAKALRDAEYFRAALKKRNFPVRSLVVNRVWPQISRASLKRGSDAARQTLEWYEELAASQQKPFPILKRDFGGDLPVFSVLEQPGEVEGLQGLLEIGRQLD